MQFASRGHRMPASGPCLHHPHLASCPGANLFDSQSRSRVLWPSRLEQMKDVLGAGRRPRSEEVVVLIGQGPATAYQHQATISDLREDHEDIVLVHIEGSVAPASVAARGAPSAA